MTLAVYAVWTLVGCTRGCSVALRGWPAVPSCNGKGEQGVPGSRFQVPEEASPTYWEKKYSEEYDVTQFCNLTIEDEEPKTDEGTRTSLRGSVYPYVYYVCE